MVRFALSLTIVLVLTNLVAARDLYVNNLTGSDLSDASTPEPVGENVGPVRSISKGLRLARKGDRVVIANTGQPYRECITLQAGGNSGWSDAPFVLAGNGATLDGSEEVADHQWEHWHEDIFRFQPKYLAYHQVFRDGLPLDRVPMSTSGVLPELEPLQWCLFEGYVYFRVEPGRLPISYKLTHSQQRVGITLYQVRHVVIEDLTVQGYQLDGINCHGNVHNGTLVGLTCRGNGRSGVSVGGASRVTLAASLVGNNGAAQVRAEGYAELTLVNNSLLDNTAEPLVVEEAKIIRRDTQPPAEGAAAEADDQAEPAAAPAEPADDTNPFGF